MTDIVFGTDGWRGKVAEAYTFDNLRRCSQGFAEYLRDTFKPAELARGVVIGHDVQLRDLSNLEFLAGSERSNRTLVDDWFARDEHRLEFDDAIF